MNKRLIAWALLLLVVCTLFSTTVNANALLDQGPIKDKFEEVFEGADGPVGGEEENPERNEDVWLDEPLGCVLCGVEHTGLKNGTMSMTAYNWCCAVYGGQLFAPKSNSIDVMKFDINSDAFQDFWRMASRFYSSMVSIGLVLCSLYGMLHLMEMSTADNTSPERICMLFIKMVIGAIVVRNGFDIVTACMDMGAGAFDAVFGELMPVGGSLADFCNYDDLVKGTQWDAIGDMFALFIPFVGVKVMQMCALVIAWTRVLELTARVIFAPIGISDLIYEGSRSSGFAYIKKLTACAMQGAMLLLIARVHSALTNAVRTLDMGFGWMIILILGIATVVIMFKAQSMTNDLLSI